MEFVVRINIGTIVFVLASQCILSTSGCGFRDGYLGCFSETPKSRVFSVSAGTFDAGQLNPGFCILQCARWMYKYSGLSEGKYCLCSNQFPPASQASADASCNSKCSDPGASSSICGGFGFVAVYSMTNFTGLQMKLMGDAGFTTIQTETPAFFNLTFLDSPLPSSIRYTIDFGHPDLNIGSSQYLVDSVIQQSYAVPGEYTISTIANDCFNTTVSLVVNVDAPVNNISIYCPPLVASTFEFACNATVLAGTNLNLTIDYNDGNTDSFVISDAHVSTAGIPVPSNLTIGGVGALTYMYVMTDAFVPNDGTLTSFEFFAESASGSITFLVFEPTCSSPSYCYPTGQCSSSCDSFVDCSTSGLFYPLKGTCSDGSVVAGSRGAWQSTTSLSLLNQFSYTLSKSGQQLYHLDTPLPVKKGYVIGWFGRSGLIGSRPNIGPGEVGDWQSSTVLAAPPSTLVNGPNGSTADCTPMNARHFLRAIITQPSIIYFYHTFASAGWYNILLKVQNQFLPDIQPQYANITILGVIPINDSTIISPWVWTTNFTLHLSLEPLTGSNVSFLWKFGDGSNATTEDPWVDHVYTVRGHYNISCFAYNTISWKQSNLTLIWIQDQLLNISVNSTRLAPALLPTWFYFFLVSGSDYECTWDMGDGGTIRTTSDTSPGNGSSSTHLYTTDGVYTVNVACNNSVSQASYTFQQAVMWTIVNLRLLKNGALKNTTFNITYLIDNGTSPVFNMTFDGKVIPTIYNQSIKTGVTVNRYGPYPNSIHPLYLGASNMFGGSAIYVNFTIETAIANPKSNCNYGRQVTDIVITYEASVTDGTSVNVTWYWMDGTPPYSIALAPLESANPFWKRTMNHSFEWGGKYNVTVTIANSYDNYTFYHPIVIFGRITNVTLYTIAPVIPFCDTFLTVPFMFKSPHPPADVTLVFNYGEGTTSPDLAFDISTVYFHNYSVEGDYQVSANISNNFTWGIFYTNFKIIRPVINMTLVYEKPHASLNIPFTMGVAMTYGTNVTLTFDFGDGISLPTVMQRKSKTFAQSDNATHTYNKTGIYIIKVNATNSFGSTVMLYRIIVQNPVTDGFTISSSYPVLFPPGLVNFTVTYPSNMTLPDNATLQIDFGDGKGLVSIPLPFTTPPYVYAASYQYSTDGNYITSFLISNMASDKNISVPSGAFAPLGDIKVVPMYQPAIPFGGPDVPAFGPSGSSFPLGLPVNFHANFTGTLVLMIVNVYTTSGVLVQQLNFTQSPASVTINNPGSYVVNVTLWNPVSQVTFSSSIAMINVVSKPSLIPGQTSASPNKPISFQVSFDDVSPTTCMTIDYGDKSSIEVYANDTKNCPTVTGTPQKLYKNMTLSHVYTKSGAFTAKLQAGDETGNVSTSVYIVVSSSQCTMPVVAIKNGSSVFSAPIRFIRKQQIDIFGYTEIVCGTTLSNSKNWTVNLTDPGTGVSITPIKNITKLISANTSQISVPSEFLALGLYSFTYGVKIEGTSFMAQATSYVRVSSSPIVAAIVNNGMSFITVGYPVDVTLSPANFSVDPDVAAGQNQMFTSFTWFCRQFEEHFPKNPDGSFITSNPSIIYTPAQLKAMNGSSSFRGGCFNQGPGAISFTGGTLTFNTLAMRENDTYVFRVIVTKEGRVDTNDVTVDVVHGTVPMIEVGCLDKELCLPLTGNFQVNPSDDLNLYAKCIPPNCPDDLVLTWVAKTPGIANSWLPVQNFSFYLTASIPAKVTISSQLFMERLAYSLSLDTFRIGVIASSPSGKLSNGSSFMDFVMNPPPSGGSCKISPLVGVATQTTFSASCQDWVDPFGVKQYQFYAVIAGDIPSEVQLGFSDNGKLPAMTFPHGAPELNYTMEVFVRIYDGNNSAFVYDIGAIQVTPIGKDASTALFNQLVNNRTSSNLMASIAAAGDLQTTCSLFAGFADALDTNLQYQMDKYGNGSLTYPNPAAANNGDYQKLRDQSANLRGQMIEALAAVTVSTIQAVQLVASTISKLTSTPSEINRKDQIIATDQMKLMASTLSSLSASTPLSDLLIAAKAITGSVGNLFQGVNYALDDGTIADIDASKLTDEYFYDAAYDSPRKGFAGGTPEEMAIALQKETNNIVQTESAQKSAATLTDTMDTVGKALRDKLVPGNPPINLITPNMVLTIQKDLPTKMQDSTILTGKSQIKLPHWSDMAPNSLNTANPSPVSYQIMSTPNDINRFFPDSSKVSPYSADITMDLFDDNGNPITIKDAKVPIEIFINRASVPRPVAEPCSPPSATEANYTMIFYKINVTQNFSSIHVDFRPDDRAAHYLVLARYNAFPEVNSTIVAWDYNQTLPITQYPRNNTNITGFDGFVFVVPNILIESRTGVWYVGIRQLENDEFRDLNDGKRNYSQLGAKNSGLISTHYNITIYTSGCYFTHKGENYWSADDGCEVSPATTFSNTICLCTHLTTFASGFTVQPNKIDFSFVLSHSSFDQNPTLYITEIVVAVVYILFFIWARYQDKQDHKKGGVTPLPDNDPTDRYLYEVIVSTGMRKDAGTNSKVQFIISGENEETDVRTFEDDRRKILRRGATDSFLVAVPRPLGPLHYMRIWHDNSGKGGSAGWYVNWIVVRDIQSSHQFYFIVNDWLAVEKSDGQISRIVSVAGPEQMTESGHLFSKKASKGLVDDHIWFSIVARPYASRFTRIQRLSCCLCLLFTAMFANAMFYGVLPATPASGIDLGPFTISGEQIYVGLISNLIVFPINFTIAFLFKHARPRVKRPSRINEALKRMKSTHQVNEEDQDDTAQLQTKTKKTEGNQENAANFLADFIGVSGMEDDNPQQKKKKKKLTLPWWCSIIAWVLLWLTVAGMVAGVTFYGIMFQDVKTKKWISSMMISFFTSVFLTQPIKIVLLAMLFALLLKKPIEEEVAEEDEEKPSLNEDEIWLHETSGTHRSRNSAYEPPDPAELERARENRLKEIKMYAILREIGIYAIFLWVAISISYNFRHPDDYSVKSNLHQSFVIGGGDPSSGSTLDSILSMNDFWAWMRKAVLPSLRADNWYNQQRPVGLRGYLQDTVSRLMGYATLRQIRVKRDLCSVPHPMDTVIPECNVAYSTDVEDTSDYYIGWSKFPLSNESNQQPPEYIYRTASELDGYSTLGTHATYSGGGYVVALKGSLHDLSKTVDRIEEDRWVDRYTRALIVEFSVYNVGANLFGIVTLVAENLESGGFDCYYRFDPMNLLTPATPIFILCVILYLILLVFFFVKEVREAKKLRWQYLTRFWSWVEIFIFVMSIASIAVYIIRYIETNKLLNIFNKSGGNAYMKFQRVAQMNEVLIYFVGLIIFWATTKFLKLLRFNKTMSMLSATLHYASTPLLSFAFIFCVIFFAFVQVFYLIYMTDLESFAGFVFASEMCLQMLIGKFDFGAMAAASPFLGTICFFVYMTAVFFITLTLFVSILTNAFEVVREDISKQSNEHEMVDFIMKRFKQLFSFVNLNPNKKNPNGQSQSGNNDDFETQMQSLSEKLDMFMDRIGDMYAQGENYQMIKGLIEKKRKN